MSGLDMMRKRMDWYGGETADGRFVDNKLRSFRSTLNNSYQAEWITYNEGRHRCLLNTDRISESYEQVLISVDYSVGIQNGSVFYWDRTNAYWLVYEQQETEEAYFRGKTRKCKYELNGWHVWAKGPENRTIAETISHEISRNSLNYSAQVWVPRNAETEEFFKRFRKLKFDGHTWEVAVVDRITMEGILVVYLSEDHDNSMEDEMIIPEIEEFDATEPHIEGEQYVKPYDEDLLYTVKNLSGGAFVVSSKKVKCEQKTDSSCVLSINSGKSFKFTLQYVIDEKVAAEREIVVQSL